MRSGSLNGLYLTTGEQHIDNLINIDHARPNTTSRLFYKGILDGKSKAVFGGEVLVRKDAQKADARQTDKNLLLSREAEVDSKPASHLRRRRSVHPWRNGGAHRRRHPLLHAEQGSGQGNGRPDFDSRLRQRIIETVQVEPLRDYLDQLFLEAIPTKVFNLERSMTTGDPQAVSNNAPLDAAQVRKDFPVLHQLVNGSRWSTWTTAQPPRSPNA